jgi:hypothetical protein
MFLGICMGYVQDAFTESILTNNTVDLRLRISVVRALGKLIWIQNDLLARWHINENNIGNNPNPQPETSGLPRSAAPSPVPSKAHVAPPLTDPFGHEGENLSAQIEKNSDSASYAGSNKTSLGRNKDSLEFDSASGGGCPFSGSSMDSQRAGLVVSQEGGFEEPEVLGRGRRAAFHSRARQHQGHDAATTIAGKSNGQDAYQPPPMQTSAIM